jgi:cytochrome c-type biogenesis protein CcmH
MSSLHLRKLLLLVCLLLPALSLSGLPAWAVEPDEMLADPKLEARARDISEHLRCLVCQNETIDDSNASLAKDLRLLVRERLTQGDSNEQTIQYVVDRYGEFVLLRPRVSGVTLILWFGPFLLLLGAGYYFFRSWRDRPQDLAPAPQKALTAEERARLAKLMRED